MKRTIVRIAVASFAFGVIAVASFAQDNNGTLIWQQGYEDTKGLMAWPQGSKITLDRENKKTGESSLLFTPDSNCTVYAYVQMKPNFKYRVNLWYKADKTPLQNNGILCNFNKKGGANGSAGNKILSFAKITADGKWHEFNEDFTSPAETAVCQFQTNFIRVNATVNIDDIKIYEMGPASDAEVREVNKPTAPAATAGTIAKIPEFANGGFEDGIAGWSSWFKPDEASFSIDNMEKHSGSASLAISGEKAGRHFIVRKVPVTPGSTYKISFWVKTSDADANCAVACDFFPVNAKPRPYAGLERMKGSKPWTQYSFYAEAPAGAQGATLCLIQGSGKIWFDDVEFSEEKE